MLFTVVAHDYTDAEALDRRMASRQAHIDLIDGLKAKGHILLGGALLNEAEQMAGSMLIADYPDEATLREQWLSKEPYILNRVWETVLVYPYRIGPSYENSLAALQGAC
jgi:uncharacterized protein